MIKILIIKLGAKGDVVRTLPLLIGIKEKYPDSEITWVTKQASKELLEIIPEIDRIIIAPCELNEEFNILYNFDIEEEAAELAKKIKAGKKYGFYDENGYAAAFNMPSEYYLNTLFDDEIKKTNKKTYQEMMFEVAELEYKKQHYFVSLKSEDKKYADDFARENNLNTRKLIGIHMGSGPRWPSKAWAEGKIKEFIKKAKEKGYEILLFGGPDEIERHEKLTKELESEGLKIYRNNPKNTDREFASLVNLCKIIVCGDSYALHVALALRKPAIALFFCTPPNEVEDYGLLKKIISPLLYDFFPEKQDQFSEELVNSISAEQVLEILEEISKQKEI